jgi:LacI family transcriptional regulator
MKTILFFISSTRHTCTDRLEGICRFARGRDWHVQVIERSFHRVRADEALAFWKPAGAIAECGSGADELNRATFGELPVVYFDADRRARGPGFYVGQDNVAVARLAAAHLFALGLDHYAFASFRLPMFWNAERRDAFADEMAARGRRVHVFDPGRALPPMVRQRRIRQWVRALPLPCGVFASNDYVGEEVVNACVALGLRVPDDVAVLGVDNDAGLCDNLSPTLSSIATDYERGGYLAAELLDAVISGAAKGQKSVLFSPSKVVRRQSTRRLACDRSKVAEALDFVRRRACEGISAADVVARMGVPRRTAELHFREATGRSILEEIDDVRFARVFELLGNPGQNLKSISDFAGFGSPAALRKAFRLKTGLSMSEWRRRDMASRA